MTKLEKEIEVILKSLLASLDVGNLPQAEPLIDLTVLAILVRIKEDKK